VSFGLRRREIGLGCDELFFGFTLLRIALLGIASISIVGVGDARWGDLVVACEFDGSLEDAYVLGAAAFGQPE
jgi:hypothetical protein